jgi:hypothetical protein
MGEKDILALAMNDKDPPYWFRAKRYGLGWGLPLVWQGWVFLVFWMVSVPIGLRLLTPVSKPLRWAFIAAMGTFLLLICYWKGDPRGRRWNSGDRN